MDLQEEIVVDPLPIKVKAIIIMIKNREVNASSLTHGEHHVAQVGYSLEVKTILKSSGEKYKKLRDMQSIISRV